MLDQKSRRGGGHNVERERDAQVKMDGAEDSGLSVGVDVMALWGMCLQGAKGPWSGGTRGGGEETRSVEKEEEEEEAGGEKKKKSRA